MSNETIEELLRGLPTRTLDAGREARLIAGLLAAGRAAREAWWRRPVRLWHSMAACAAAAMFAAVVTGAWREQSPRATVSAAAPAVHTRIDAALFASGANADVKVDLAEWRLLAVTPTGDRR